MKATNTIETALPELGRLELYTKALAWNRGVMRIRVRGCLRDQLHRAATSVLLNIAEGAGHASWGAKKRHYQIAMASLYEVAAVMDLISTRVHPDLVHGLREVRAMLAALTR